MEKALHLTDYLQLNAEKTGSKPAIIFEGKSISWKELWQEVEAKSRFFTGELGNKEQKVVDLLLTNSTEFVVIYLAVLHAGHIALPLDPAFKKLELDAIIDQIAPALIVTSERYKDQISHHQAATILAGDIKPIGPGINRPLRLSPYKQIASLTFTSGTSGRPKAAPNTHANHAWNIKVCSQVWGWTTKDSLLITLPLSHWYGLVMGLSGAIYHGNTLYLHEQAFNPNSTLEALSSGQISMFTHVPLAYLKMLELDDVDKYDLSRVRLCISGGAALSTTTWQAFKDKFGVEIVETYGSSETGRIAGNRLDRRMPGSPGQPLPEVDLRISEEGEVTIKSPGVFPGYYHNAEATKKAKTSEGYWRTGDLAELRDGYIFLKGRVQERIRRFGYTVSPRDVEWAVHKLPGIKDIFVMGRQRPDQPNDELIYFVVSNLNEAEIQDFCKANLLFAWRADKIRFLDELPRTRSGKARIGALKELAGQAV